MDRRELGRLLVVERDVERPHLVGELLVRRELAGGTLVGADVERELVVGPDVERAHVVGGRTWSAGGWSSGEWGGADAPSNLSAGAWSSRSGASEVAAVAVRGRNAMSGPARVWLLTATLAVATGLAVTTAASFASPPQDGPAVPWVAPRDRLRGRGGLRDPPQDPRHAHSFAL